MVFQFIPWLLSALGSAGGAIGSGAGAVGSALGSAGSAIGGSAAGQAIGSAGSGLGALLNTTAGQGLASYGLGEIEKTQAEERSRKASGSQSLFERLRGKKGGRYQPKYLRRKSYG